MDERTSCQPVCVEANIRAKNCEARAETVEAKARRCDQHGDENHRAVCFGRVGRLECFCDSVGRVDCHDAWTDFVLVVVVEMNGTLDNKGMKTLVP